MLLLSVLKEAPKTEPNFKYSPMGLPVTVSTAIMLQFTAKFVFLIMTNSLSYSRQIYRQMVTRLKTDKKFVRQIKNSQLCGIKMVSVASMYIFYIFQY